MAGQEGGRSIPHSHDHHGHSHEHRNLHDIRHLVEDHLQLPEAVRGDILAVYDAIAQAESHVHGVPVTDIHFHEVGTMDAVADITAVCLLIHTLAPEEILASRCGWAAARCGAPMGCCRFRPLPQRFCCGRRPFMPETWQGELCTPTGAALLTHFVTKFGPMPVMQVEKIGYGMGKKDFPAANCVGPCWAGGRRGGYRLPAGMQSGRHDPGGAGLCPGATVGGWGPGCIRFPSG